MAEIGCGSGNLTLPLAALLPSCQFTMVDRNAYAVELAKKRAAQAGLTNVDRFLACSANEVRMRNRLLLWRSYLLTIPNVVIKHFIINIQGSSETIHSIVQ